MTVTTSRTRSRTAFIAAALTAVPLLGGVAPAHATPLPTTPLQPRTSPDTATTTRWVSVPVANVRSGPSMSAAVVGTLTKDTELTGTLSAGWLKLGDNRYIGLSVTTTTPPGGDPAPAPAPPSSDTVTRWVSVGVANVRSGPGTSYGVVGSATRDTELSGTLTSNGWLNLGNGRYISGTVVTSTPPGGSAPAPAPPSSDTVTRWVSVSVANVRSGPSTSYGVVGSATRDTELTGTLTSNGWLNLGNGRYISGTVVTSTPPGGSAPAPAPPAADTVTRWVSVNLANVRSGPSTSYGVVGSASRGTQLTGTLTSNGWLNLGNGRYISGTVVTSTPPGSNPTPPPDQTVTRWVSASLANVRSGPGTSYGVVGTASRGTQLTGTLTSNGWLNMGNGRYISGTVITATPPRTGLPTGEEILAEGRKYFGIMYVWGGDDPSGFDCSGYTQYVFGQLGVNLPRTVAAQKAATTPVSTPRVGDLVFWGDYHVAIYAGNNRIYDSGRPGLPVQERNMFSGYTSFGRIG